MKRVWCWVGHRLTEWHGKFAETWTCRDGQYFLTASDEWTECVRCGLTWSAR
jgi:hypothetical protein